MARVLGGEPGRTEFRRRPVPNVRLFILDRALDIMIGHAHSRTDAEIMGLMVGNVWRDDGGTYATVHRTITSGLCSGELSVRFDPDSLTDLFDAVDAMDGEERITGWYHSHLGIGCSMSDTDRRTHSGIFGGECGFAVVIDPLRREVRAFAPDSEETMFIVMEDHTHMA